MCTAYRLVRRSPSVNVHPSSDVLLLSLPMWPLPPPFPLLPIFSYCLFPAHCSFPFAASFPNTSPFGRENPLAPFQIAKIDDFHHQSRNL